MKQKVVISILVILPLLVFPQNSEKHFCDNLDIGIGIQRTVFNYAAISDPFNPDITPIIKTHYYEPLTVLHINLQYHTEFFNTQFVINQPICKEKYWPYDIIGRGPLFALKYGQNLFFYTDEAKKNGFHFGPSAYVGWSFAGYYSINDNITSPIVGHGFDISYRNIFCGFSMLYCTRYSSKRIIEPPLFHQAYIGYAIPHIFKKRTPKKNI